MNYVVKQISICIGMWNSWPIRDQQRQRTIFEYSRDASTTSESTNGKKRAVIFEAMTLIVQMIQSVTSIFQLLAAPLIFIYEDRASPSANLIDTELKSRVLVFFFAAIKKQIIIYRKYVLKKWFRKF